MKRKKSAYSVYSDGKVFYRIEEMNEQSEEVAMLIKESTSKRLIDKPVFVSTAERNDFLLPWIWLCYNPHSSLKECGPHFFAELLSLFTRFEKRGPGECYLTVAEISRALQTAHRAWHDKQ